MGPGWAGAKFTEWSAIKSVGFANFRNTFALLNMNFGSGFAILLFLFYFRNSDVLQLCV